MGSTTKAVATFTVAMSVPWGFCVSRVSDVQRVISSALPGCRLALDATKFSQNPPGAGWLQATPPAPRQAGARFGAELADDQRIAASNIGELLQIHQRGCSTHDPPSYSAVA